MNTRDLWAALLGVLMIAGLLWWSGLRDMSAMVASVSGFLVAKLARLWWRNRKTSETSETSKTGETATSESSPR